MGCAGSKKTKKSRTKKTISQPSSAAIIGSKIIQEPSALQQQILLPSQMSSMSSKFLLPAQSQMAPMMTSQQQSTYDSKLDSKLDGCSIISNYSALSQGGLTSSSMLPSQVNPSEYTSSAGGIGSTNPSSYGGSSVASSASSNPYSVISAVGSLANSMYSTDPGSAYSGIQSSNAKSSITGPSKASTNISGVEMSNVSNMNNQSYLSGVSVVTTTPVSSASYGQKLFTPSQIYTRFLDEKNPKQQQQPQKQPIAKFSKL